MREMKEQNFTWNLQSIHMENHGRFNGYFWANWEKYHENMRGDMRNIMEIQGNLGRMGHTKKE